MRQTILPFICWTKYCNAHFFWNTIFLYNFAFYRIWSIYFLFLLWSLSTL